MSQTNCVNCGGAKDPFDIKCPHCGTTFLDFTCVDLTGKTPCVLKLRMPGSQEIVQVIARPTVSAITMEPETITMDFESLYMSPMNEKRSHFLQSNNVTVEITFNCMCDY